MTVRAAEQFVKNYGAEKVQKTQSQKDSDIRKLEHDLSEKLCSQVSIQHSKQGKGKLVISYHSVDELEGILSRIK